MTLLERDTQLQVLLDALADAQAGRGSTVLVTGEAGIGKTSLVREFARRVPGRLLWAGCDDLVTPRTLGPLHDAAAGTDGPLARALAGEAPVFNALLEELAATVLIIEDAHWADDATLDVLGYAARRVAPLGALLVLTLRDGTRWRACSGCSRASRCTGWSCRPVGARGARHGGAGGPRRRGGLRAHQRQSVLRLRGVARRPARCR